MKVYNVLYVPYGCPAGDVYVSGVFSTQEKALGYIVERYNEDCEYDDDFTPVTEYSDIPKEFAGEWGISENEVF